VELVVFLGPEGSHVGTSEEKSGEEDPEPGLGSLSNGVGNILKSDGAVLVDWSVCHV
jgi:hypothetical protein